MGNAYWHRLIESLTSIENLLLTALLFTAVNNPQEQESINQLQQFVHEALSHLLLTALPIATLLLMRPSHLTATAQLPIQRHCGNFLVMFFFMCNNYEACAS